MKRGFEENVTVDEGTSPNGVNMKIHFEGDTVTVEKTYDAEPHLEHARLLRDSQDGQRWGDGKWIGHIPPAEYARILALPREQRRPAIHKFLRDNQQFVGFSRWLKR
jgi:hypothetical protein